MVSTTYISNKQITIVDRPEIDVSNLPRNTLTGIQIPVLVPTTIKVDLKNTQTNEFPFIHQIFVGSKVSAVELTIVDETLRKTTEVIVFPTIPGVIEVNKNLTSIEIKIIRTPDDNKNTVVDLKVVGCFKETPVETTIPIAKSTTTTTTTTTTTASPTTTVMPPIVTKTPTPTVSSTTSPTTTTVVTQPPVITTTTKEDLGCVVDGKHYENHQSINSTSHDKCSTRFCYCEKREVKCRSNPETTVCQPDEIKVCSKPNPDLTCCSCVKNVTEVYCQIDYLCNAQCGVCIDGIDAWGKETVVKNSTQCVCKDGYQSFIESIDETVNGTKKTKISAKCMSATNDNSDCGTTPRQVTTTSESTTTTTQSTTATKPSTTSSTTTTQSTTLLIPTQSTTTSSTTSTTTGPPTPTTSPVIVTATPSTTSTTTTTQSTTSLIPTQSTTTSSTTSPTTSPTSGVVIIETTTEVSPTPSTSPFGEGSTPLGNISSTTAQLSSIPEGTTPLVTITASTTTTSAPGCVVEGKHYENHQSINSTSSDKCSTRFCYCENNEVKCRSNPETTICQPDEVKVCSKPNPDLTCCSCVKNVTEVYCQIDYLCNAQCGVCIDGIDAWGKETVVKNSTQCVCKDGYQSFIESIDETVNGTKKTKISAKCMSATNDNSDCGTTPRQVTTTSASTMTTQSTTSSTTTTKSTTSLIPTQSTTTSSTTSVTTPTTSPIIVTATPSSTSTTTTTKSTTPLIPTQSTTTSSTTTRSQTVTVPTETTSTTMIPTITSISSSTSTVPTTSTKPVERNCYVFFCESVTCRGECVGGEGRREKCENLRCRGSFVVKRNETHIFCSSTGPEDCETTTSPSTTSLPTTVTTLATTTPRPPMCVIINCAVFTCSEECKKEELVEKECALLACEFGKIMIKRNDTYMWCASSIEQSCLTSPPYTTTVSTTIATTPAVSQCTPLILLNTEALVAQSKSSSNSESLTYDKWMSTTTDIVPILEFQLKNTMRLVKIEMFNVSNVKRMQIHTSDDGEHYAPRSLYLGSFSSVEKYITYDYNDTFVLGIKFVVFEKYQSSLGIVMNIKVHGCGKVCQLPMIHVKCLCQKTCDSISKEKGFSVCPKTCFPGCECPEGMVNENGKCIKITECPCFYKGRSYAFGDKIVTSDPCKQLVCTKESLQEVTLENCTNVCKETMEPCSCDGCHRTCEKNNLSDNCKLNACKSGCCCPKGTIYSEVLQKCVNNCPCIYENVTYNVGDKWTNRCLKCSCDAEKGAYCVEDGCHFDTCPSRQKMVNENPNDNICCKCVPIDPVCTFNRKDYKVGEIWNEGPCLSYKCTIDEGKPTVTSESVTCEQIACASNEQMVNVAGKCCPVCVPLNITTTSRVQTTTPYSLSTTETQQKCRVVLQYKTMKRNGCVSVNPLQVGSCEGLCFGRSRLNEDLDNQAIIRECTCCLPQLGSLSAEFKCADGIKLMRIMNVIGCNCDECR